MGLSSKQVSSDHLEFNWSTSTTQNMMLTSTQDTMTTILQQSSSNQQRSTPMKRSLQTTTTQQQSADPLKCPRCDSTNTKFCYYNNYNKTQPRHFCKACKRHWTKGGTLRNVPVGGGRKNKRIKRPANTATTLDHFNDQKKYMMMFPPQDDDQDNKAGNNLFFKLPNDHNGHEFIDQVSNSWDFNMQQSTTTHQNLGFSLLNQNLITSIDHTNLIPININPPTSTSFAALLSDHDSTQISMIPPPNAMQEVATTTTSNFLEPSYWSWNDIADSMVQADLNKTFEHHK